MKRILLLVLISLGIQPAISQSVLFECGQNSGQNFDGWHISPYMVFDAVEFDPQSVTFFVEHGGNFPVTLTRKVEELMSYESLSILFNFDVIHNCIIENVVYYTSVDGKTWKPINSSKNNSATTIDNADFNITYVRATANVQFFDNGKIACNYVKIEGESEETSLALKEMTGPSFGDQFFIFSHLHNLNIETALEGSYEVLITSMTGQIVFREHLEGSQRIELPSDMIGLFIVSVIQNNAFQASKKIAL
ncbi:MAG: hypothetical protein GQ574_24405 [Crocinitomix sp.]|nr:hypothetical protein [Crocinitomix sp.]